jgi:hypothetical protein
MDIVFLLIKNGADVLASARDFTGLLSMAMGKDDNIDHSNNILKLVIDGMIPSIQSETPLLMEFLQHRIDPS